jgi:hypothetical protein
MRLFRKKEVDKPHESAEDKKPHEVIKDLVLWKKGDRLYLRMVLGFYGYGNYFYEAINENGDLYCKIGAGHEVLNSRIGHLRIGEIFKINIFETNGNGYYYKQIKNTSLKPVGCEEYQQFLVDLRAAYDIIKGSHPTQPLSSLYT